MKMGQRRRARNKEALNAISTRALNFKRPIDMITNKYLFDFTTFFLHMWGWSACPLRGAIKRLLISSNAKLQHLLRSRRL